VGVALISEDGVFIEWVWQLMRWVILSVI